MVQYDLRARLGNAGHYAFWARRARRPSTSFRFLSARSPPTSIYTTLDDVKTARPVWTFNPPAYDLATLQQDASASPTKSPACCAPADFSAGCEPKDIGRSMTEVSVSTVRRFTGRSTTTHRPRSANRATLAVERDHRSGVAKSSSTKRSSASTSASRGYAFWVTNSEPTMAWLRAIGTASAQWSALT